MKTNHKLLLVVVAKAPQPAKVKTRLSPELSPDEASNLYHCFIRDRIREISLLKDIDLAIAYTPPESKDFFSRFLSNGFRLFPQRGLNLGQRLHNIFVDKLQQEYQAVTIIDSDTPDLPRTIVQQSFQLLGSNGVDAVFGPCHDGGYYLVGMQQPHPELFQNIVWSTATVLQDTLGIAEKSGIRTKLLKHWNDLDTFEDLLAYYHKHKNKLSDHNWTGCETFNYLCRLKSIRPHHPNIGGDKNAIEARLKEMEIELPPAVTPVANYVPAVKSGHLVFLSGHGPFNEDGSLITGKVGVELTVEQGYQAARRVAIGLLGSLKAEIGDLDRVKRVLKLLGMVNCSPEFTDQPKVINGASDFLVEVFGDKGKHARSAVGMSALPMNIAVEIEMIVAVED